jgi:hypothetical protein
MFKEKYLKYKIKYLELESQIGSKGRSSSSKPHTTKYRERLNKAEKQIYDANYEKLPIIWDKLSQNEKNTILENIKTDNKNMLQYFINLDTSQINTIIGHEQTRTTKYNALKSSWLTSPYPNDKLKQMLIEKYPDYKHYFN